MKKYLSILLLFTSLAGFSQVKVGFELGGGLLRMLDSISYTNKTLSFSGNVGINLDFQLLNNKIAVETGLLFYDTYYRTRGPRTKIFVKDGRGSSFVMNSKINDFGLKIPLRLVANLGKLCPFVGVDMNISLSPNRTFKHGLYDIGAREFGFWANGFTLIELAPYTWNLSGGLYYKHSPTVKYRVQYNLGMNSFVNYTITERKINDVVIGSPLEESTRMQQLQLAIVYTPNWHKYNIKTIKENIKELYQ